MGKSTWMQSVAEGLLSLVTGQRAVFLAEEHSTRGGVATTVADTIIDARMNDVHLVRIGFPSDEYAILGPPYYLYKHYGLDVVGLAERIRKVLYQETT